jgi:hypothetical protein
MIAKRHIRGLIPGTMLIVLLAPGSVAQAVTVQYDGSVATSITGVQIYDTLYDVSFEFGVFWGVYGFGVAPTFGEVCALQASPENRHACGLGDPTDSMVAMDTVNEILNNTNAVSVGPSSDLAFERYVVPYMIDWCAEELRVQSDYVGGVWVNSGQQGPWCAPAGRSFAVFSVSGIPIPAAFWLFGTAIFGLIGMRRKAKLAA